MLTEAKEATRGSEGDGEEWRTGGKACPGGVGEKEGVMGRSVQGEMGRSVEG
jgi:hypothetical protein